MNVPRSRVGLPLLFLVSAIALAGCGAMTAGYARDANVARAQGHKLQMANVTDPDTRAYLQTNYECGTLPDLSVGSLETMQRCMAANEAKAIATFRGKASVASRPSLKQVYAGAADCIQNAPKMAKLEDGAVVSEGAAVDRCFKEYSAALGNEAQAEEERVAGGGAPAPPAAAPAAAAAVTPVATPSAGASAPPYVVAAPQPSAYALIIGIEKYRDVPAPTGARTDAEKFANLARKTLGVPEDHIKVALDDRATKGDIEKHLEWLKTNAQPGSRIYFFFSGHGAPEPSTGTSYVLPYDGDPRYLEGTALRLQTVLARLQETKAREVLAVLDSCFSGAGGRSVLPPGARALVRVQAPPTAARIALFSAASGAETSGPAPGTPDGLFTKMILDGLGKGDADMNGDGQVSLEELRDWVKPRVTREAKRDHRDQTPNLFLGNNVGAANNFIVAWGLATK